MSAHSSTTARARRPQSRALRLRPHLAARRRPLIFVLGGSSRPRLAEQALKNHPVRAAMLASGATQGSGLDGFLADTDRLCWVIPALLQGGAPMVLARILAARQSRRQGRLPAVRRYWDMMIGAWIELFKVAFFDLAGVSDAPTRFSAGSRGGLVLHRHCIRRGICAPLSSELGSQTRPS